MSMYQVPTKPNLNRESSNIEDFSEVPNGKPRYFCPSKNSCGAISGDFENFKCHLVRCRKLQYTKGFICKYNYAHVFMEEAEKNKHEDNCWVKKVGGKPLISLPNNNQVQFGLSAEQFWLKNPLVIELDASKFDKSNIQKKKPSSSNEAPELTEAKDLMVNQASAVNKSSVLNQPPVMNQSSSEIDKAASELEALSYLFQYDLSEERKCQGIRLLQTRKQKHLSTKNVVIREFEEVSKYMVYFSKDCFTKETYDSVLALEFVLFDGSSLEESFLFQKMGKNLLGLNKDHTAGYNEVLVLFSRNTEVIGNFLEKMSQFGVMVIKWAQLSGTSLSYVPQSGSPWFEKIVHVKEEMMQMIFPDGPLHRIPNERKPPETNQVRDYIPERNVPLETHENNERYIKNEASIFESYMSHDDQEATKNLKKLEDRLAHEKEKYKSLERSLDSQRRELEEELKEEKENNKQLLEDIEKHNQGKINYESLEQKKRKEKSSMESEKFDSWMRNLYKSQKDKLEEFRLEIDEMINGYNKDIIDLTKEVENLKIDITEGKNKVSIIESEQQSLLNEKEELLKIRNKLKRELAYKKTHKGKAEPEAKKNIISCFICDEKIVSFIYLPCRHVVVCKTCGDSMIQTLNRGDCVFCLEVINDTKIFSWE